MKLKECKRNCTDKENVNIQLSGITKKIWFLKEKLILNPPGKSDQGKKP